MSAKFSGEYGGNVVVFSLHFISVFYFLFSELFAVATSLRFSFVQSNVFFCFLIFFFFNVVCFLCLSFIQSNLSV